MALANNCDTSCTLTMRNAVDLSGGYLTASLSFWRFVDSTLDRDEYLKVEAYDGTRWNTIYHWSENLGGDDNTWHQESFDLSTYLSVSDFKVRFVTQESSSYEYVQVDDVEITVGLGPGQTRPQASVTLLHDAFSEYTPYTNWVETGDMRWSVTTSQSHYVPIVPGHASDNTVVHADNCDNLCTLTLRSPIDLTAGYQSASLNFWRFVDSGLDSAEYLKVEAYDGTRWNTIYHWSGNNGGDDNTWHMESYDLASYLSVSNFKVRITTQESSSTKDVQLDDISITAVRTA